jgi:hypothetical protein
MYPIVQLTKLTVDQWIDTCCIDKTSSAELSEAINSMYRWYQRSQVCYAYLVDVPDATADHSRPDSLFQQSKWFTRGWTLQELLAPTFVEFYDQNWIEIGTKSSMRTLVQKITNISILVDIDEACVAEKLSWASTRVTTRIEDLAYCLMGLFDVNMPLLYGEGHSAFLRLQLEIWSRTNDESIFAWGTPSLEAPHYDPRPTLSLLAPSQNLFKGLNGIETFEGIWEQTFPKTHLLDAVTLTNRGTCLDFRALEFPVIRVSRKSRFWMNEFLLPLNCGRKDIVQGIQLFAIHLYQSPEKINWYRDLRLILVSIEVIKANSLKSEHLLINIPHYSPRMARQVATAGVLFDTTSLSDDRLRVSEKFFSFPPKSRGAFQWTIIDGKSVLLSFDTQFPNCVHFAALRISAEWAEWDIILLFEYKYICLRDEWEGVASLSIQSLPRIQQLDDWMNRKSPSELSGLFVEGNDRGTCPLPDGRYISANLKKGIHSENPVFKITTTISAGKEQLGSYAIAE